MNKEQYFEFHDEFTRSMATITREKNSDYTGSSGDPFANFTRVEALGICSTEQGFLTRMTDKLCRISSFVQKGTLLVKDESVQDTLKDLANYSILMAAFIESKKKPPTEGSPALAAHLQWLEPNQPMSIDPQADWIAP